MKRSIAYVIDVGGDLAPRFMEKNQVYTLPCGINFKDKEYTVGVDIDRETLLRKMEEEIPTTSICSLDYLEEILEDIRSRQVDDVLIVTMGDKFSSLHSVVNLYAKAQEDLNIYCFNSGAVSFQEGAYLVRALALEEEGVPFQEICQRLEEEKKKNQALLVAYFRSLDQLIRGGRIKKTQGALANVLNVRPILTIHDGLMQVKDKVRGEKKAFHYLKKKVQEKIQPGRPYYLSLLYGEEGDRDQLLALFKEELAGASYGQVQPLSPIVLVHSGPQVAGVVLYPLDQ